jgi:hypothetical protein
MRKSLVLLAILAPAVLAADVASAANSLSQCGTEFANCQIRCSGQKVFQDACFNRCESNRKTCVKNATGGKPGKGKLEVGGNVVVTPTGTGGVRNLPLNQVKVPINATPVPLNVTPVRPGPGGNPCTVHCGPLGGRKR